MSVTRIAADQPIRRKPVSPSSADASRHLREALSVRELATMR